MTGINQFKSDCAKDIFESHTSDFKATQFNFRSPAEHRIGGARYDLELQTLFNADGDGTSDIKGAAIGILFAEPENDAFKALENNPELTKAEELIIKTFFETLSWGEKNPTVNLVTYGELMSMINMKSRYIYKGSITQPPCQQSIYWNVPKTIYPVDKKYVEQF